ncbi:MAG: HAD family hydrolase [Verrucomicrobiales bacterium]
MNPASRAVIFDLDGTLLDTLRDLADSGNAVLQGRGFPGHDLDAYRGFVGSGMEELVRAIFPGEHRPVSEEAVAEALAEYRGHYASRWRNTTAPYPGIPALLDELAAKGVPVGVLSNKAHDFTVKCVEAFLGDWTWDMVLGQREGTTRKPDPSGALEVASALGVAPENCFFVGDSDVDMLTARNAGMRVVGVDWGFRSREELLEAGAETILETPADLLEMVQAG